MWGGRGLVLEGVGRVVEILGVGVRVGFPERVLLGRKRLRK